MTISRRQKRQIVRFLQSGQIAHRVRRCGFTLVEVMVSMSIMAIAGAAILLGVQSAVKTADETVEQTIATGMARQLLGEVLGSRYATPGSGPYDVSAMGPSSREKLAAGRVMHDDTDDYLSVQDERPQDRWGSPLGHGDGSGNVRATPFAIRSGMLDNWRQKVDIYYVSNSDPSVKMPPGKPSDYRAAEVYVYRIDSNGKKREVYRTRQVFTYLQSP